MTLHETLKNNLKKKNTKIAFIVGIAVLLITVVGASFAYFSVTSANNATNTTSTGALQSTGNVTLETNTPNLYLNLDGVLMSEGNVGSKYWATTDNTGTPITTPTAGNGIYTLATVSLASGETQYNCTYNYDLSATVNSPITDGSDEDIKVTIKGSSITGGEKTYTLKDIIAGGQTLTGLFKRVTNGTPQTITIESTVENTADKQDDFAGNNYSITLTPKSGTQGFSCTVAEPLQELATKLINDGNMWQSGLEGDGYRFVGSGVATDATSPDNFICFGTTSKTDCKANESKYLYRIIGVFEDNNGNSSVKLIKYKQLATKYAWHSSASTNVEWEQSDMYNGINGTYFLTNTAYDYMQQTNWSNMISNWRWSAVNTKSGSDGGPNYYNGISPSNIYLHEMNKSSKTSTIGSWTTPVAKIGLMYGSDYLLSLGNAAKMMTTSTYANESVLITGWLHPSNSDMAAYTSEWTMSRSGYGSYSAAPVSYNNSTNDVTLINNHQNYNVSNAIIKEDNAPIIIEKTAPDLSSGYSAWFIYYYGSLANYDTVSYLYGVRPVFYLTSDVTYGSGTGDYSDPIIIG